VCALCIVIDGCNITYKVRNQHNDIEQLIHFPCGKISIELIGKGNSKFVLKQSFDLDQDIIINMDSLIICYNDLVVDADHKHKNSKSNQKEMIISEKKILETAFELHKGVFEGDTITVFGKKYMKCDNVSITLDTIIYSFRNNLRIRGVNDF